VLNENYPEVSMAIVIYGAWDEKVTDNRNIPHFEIEELPEFEVFDEFNPGNPIRAFFGGKGFYIFDKDVNILDAVRQYIARAARESCGKCTPCRVGLPIIKSKLDDLASGKGDTDSIKEIRALAE
jgi:formate dehydrogenase beta subunit